MTGAGNTLIREVPTLETSKEAQNEFNNSCLSDAQYPEISIQPWTPIRRDPRRGKSIGSNGLDAQRQRE